MANVGRSASLLVGVGAFLVSVVGAGRPSLWLDEAATISAATRPVPQMFGLLEDVDAVHGLYYLLMHAWFAVFPATEFWARMPSSLMIGGTAAGVVVVGRQISTRPIAVAAGVVFAILPRTTWTGVEARSYALSMLDAVWLTALLIFTIRLPRIWLWCCYATALALAIIGNVFLVFLVVAHAAVVARTGRSRAVAVAWVAAVGAAIIAVVPFLCVVGAQRAQVNWIPPINPGTLGQILGDQYFPAVYSDSARATGLDTHGQVSAEQVTAALHAWALVAPFLLAVLLVVVAAVRRRRRASPATGGEQRLLTWTATAWVVAPPTLLIGYSVFWEPMYQPHYLAYTVPGFALLLGRCVVAVGREPGRIAVVLAVVGAAAVPNYVAQRGPYAKFGQDYSQVADLVAERAAAGDCLAVTESMPSDLAKGMTAGRADAFAALHDYGRDHAARSRDVLFAPRAPISEWADELPTCAALWTIAERDPGQPDHASGQRLAPGPRVAGDAAYRVSSRYGFRIVEQWQFNVTGLTRSTR